MLLFNIVFSDFYAIWLNLPVFSIQNAWFSFCFYTLLFIWLWFGKESKDLYTDAQVVSHPWFLSTPYFRCHHADVSLNLHLLLMKSHFQILGFFSLSSGKCSLSSFYFFTICFFSLYKGSVYVCLNEHVLYQYKIEW